MSKLHLIEMQIEIEWLATNNRDFKLDAKNEFIAMNKSEADEGEKLAKNLPWMKKNL